MKDNLSAFITLVSLSSSTVFLYLTFNDEVNSFLSARFDFIYLGNLSSVSVNRTANGSSSLF
jgi:hypothetical protein